MISLRNRSRSGRAKRLHHLRTGPEHILLAMAKDESSRAGTMLALAGLTPERIERLLKE